MIDDAASSPKCVILNDTSTRYHHGCIRVMEQLKSGLVDRGITIAACAPARHDWENDPKLIEHIRRCDLVVQMRNAIFCFVSTLLSGLRLSLASLERWVLCDCALATRTEAVVSKYSYLECLGREQA